MAKEIIYLTAEGYKKLKDDLDHMRSVERPAISAAIAEARDKGDLSENAEYDAAREAQGLLEMRIAKLEETIANARVIDESKIDKSKVQILSRVTLLNHTNGKQMCYTIVSENEANLREGKLAIGTPIAKALLGKKKGDRGRGGSRRYDPLRDSGYFDLTLRFSCLAGAVLRGGPAVFAARGGGGVRPAAERAASGAADGRCGECPLRGERPRSSDTADAGSSALCAGLPDGRRSPHRTEARRLNGYEGRRCCHRSIRIVVRPCAGALTLLRCDGQPAGSATCGNAAAARYRLRSTKEIIRWRICRV